MQDIQGHWAQYCIEDLAKREIFVGYRDSLFRPDQPVTRAEFAAIIARAFDLPEKRSPKAFPDVPNHFWAATVIQQVYRAGWLSGYPDGTFHPELPMPRCQVVVALAMGLALPCLRPPEPLLKRVLQDAADIPTYAIAGIAAALEHQLVVNHPHADRLEPLRPATRADVAAFVYQAIVYQTGSTSGLSQEMIAGAAALTIPAPPRELRGVWLTNVDSDVLFSRQNLATAIDRLASCHFNTLYPTIWNGGYTLFPSEVAAQVLGERQRLYPGLTRSLKEETQIGRDLVQECLELAHARAMKVIPWFEYGFFARPGNTLRQRHPDWFTHQRDGAIVDRHTMEWLNPFHPEVQQFFLSLIAEFMSRYAVDGFQIDDHFGLPTEFGYDAYTVRLYRSETGQLPPANPHEAQWKRWRADKITQFVQQVAKTVKLHRPQAIFSVSPNPPEFSYDNFLQDWPAWIQLAGVNEVVIQTYRWNLASFINEIRKPSIQQWLEQVPVSVGVLAGLKHRPLPLALLKQQCQAVRVHGYAGMSFFFYETLWQTSGESLTVREGTYRALFPAAIERPERPREV